MPGAFHFWEFIEFFYYLKELGYTDDWYAYDVMSKEILELARLAAVGASHQNVPQKVVDELTACALQTDETLLNTKQARR